jgi:hypothetical protein
MWEDIFVGSIRSVGRSVEDVFSAENIEKRRVSSIPSDSSVSVVLISYEGTSTAVSRASNIALSLVMAVSSL